MIPPGTLLTCGCGECTWQVGLIVGDDKDKRRLIVLWTTRAGTSVVDTVTYLEFTTSKAIVGCPRVAHG